MKVTAPGYYRVFRCIAAACPDSCCKEWAVQVDAESAQRYRALSGELGDRLRAVMEEEEGETILKLTPDGRCPMWRKDGLCAIQAQLGEEALCHTCKDFPRLRHDYGDFVELGLELSCPEAARLILDGGEGERVAWEQPGGENPEYDEGAMEILLRSRETVLSFLREKAYPVGQALAIMLLYGYAVQNELDGGEQASLTPEEDLRRVRGLAKQGSAHNFLAFYKDLEILTGEWRQRLESPQFGEWTETYRALARYFVERYWLQAVSDYDLISRVKLVVCSCLAVKILGGDPVRTAQLYSKEIENDAENVDALLDGAYTSPALADVELLGLLLT